LISPQVIIVLVASPLIRYVLLDNFQATFGLSVQGKEDQQTYFEPKILKIAFEILLFFFLFPSCPGGQYQPYTGYSHCFACPEVRCDRPELKMKFIRFLIPRDIIVHMDHRRSLRAQRVNIQDTILMDAYHAQGDFINHILRSQVATAARRVTG